ncbi:hypothetical protein Y032_0082g1565 [Ancylostoma ceylanicum]|uniref:RanBP2-type domain-containing protein n=1 Tax=Ancylostoma ceylanicum TaxID=53326 RepID=A0A016TRL3_9BILA|nr:hypothetical protein Y032_0082g1565 [Ancylostoma ceylanicum]
MKARRSKSVRDRAFPRLLKISLVVVSLFNAIVSLNTFLCLKHSSNPEGKLAQVVGRNPVMGTRHDDGGSAHEKEMRSRRILKEGEWACTDPKCAQVNAEYRNACEACGKSKPRSKNRVGKEIGKEMADKSKGLFAAEDWVCSKCGNVNWARRKTCNVCNAPKLADLEKRTGYGGGFNDRQDIEYIKRDHDDEFDEFGRKKKRKEDPNAAPPPSREIYETKDTSALDEEEEEEEGEISKYKLGSDEEDEESEEEDDDAILEKYDLTADPELAEIKIEVKRPPPRPVESE